MIDEEGGKPYESIEDWKKEVRHLKWAIIIMIYPDNRFDYIYRHLLPG